MPISPTVVTECVVAAAAVGPPIVGSVIDLIYKRSLDPSRAHAITANKSDRATATAVAHTIPASWYATPKGNATKSSALNHRGISGCLGP